MDGYDTFYEQIEDLLSKATLSLKNSDTVHSTKQLKEAITIYKSLSWKTDNILPAHFEEFQSVT